MVSLNYASVVHIVNSVNKWLTEATDACHKTNWLINTNNEVNKHTYGSLIVCMRFTFLTFYDFSRYGCFQLILQFRFS